MLPPGPSPASDLGYAGYGEDGRRPVAWPADETDDARWDEGPEADAPDGAGLEGQSESMVRDTDDGEQSSDRVAAARGQAWHGDPDADGDPDPLQARYEVDEEPTVSPDDPEWTYANTAVVDEVIDEPVQGTDWLDRICPYLLSEDGTARSSQPDERHRCTAQDPPATLPFAFQERFCLTERHVRCEMYKVAEDARTQAFVEDSIPAEQVRSARFRPTVRSRPVALEPTPSVAPVPPQGPTENRQVLVALAAAGGFALVLLVLAILLGGGGGAPGTGSPGPDGGVASTVEPERTLAPDPTLGGGVTASLAPADDRPPIVIRYELQPGERLVRIAETFGTSRLAIERVNEDLGAELEPRDARVGDVIFVPVSPEMSEAEIQAFPGFVEFVEAGEPPA